jgi:HECT-domain (ubiquitin-transferase)
MALIRVLCLYICYRNSITTGALQLQPYEMCDIVCGSSGDDVTVNFKLRDVFHVTEDSDFLDAHDLREAFWHVVDTVMTVQEKRGLLVFITGLSRLPAAKTELMAIELLYLPRAAVASPTKQHTSATTNNSAAAAYELVLGRILSSHTCDNVLEVPDYWTALISKHKQLHASNSSKQAASASAFNEHNLSAKQHEQLTLEVSQLQLYNSTLDITSCIFGCFLCRCTGNRHAIHA